MACKLKAAYALAFAVCGVSGMLPSAAQATAATLTTFPAGSSVIVTGVQTNILRLELTDHPVSPGSAKLECNVATFTGTEAAKEGATTLRFHPIYGECKFAGSPATVSTTGCDYVLHTGTPTLTAGWHSVTDIACTGGSVIKIVSGTCEVQIGSQNGLATTEVTNSGTSTAMDLALHTKLTGITYTTIDRIGCVLSGSGTYVKGDYTGTGTLRAHDAFNKLSVGVTLH